MNSSIANRITCISLLIIFAFVVALGIIRIINGPPPLICRIYTWDHPEGKTVKCHKVGSDVAGPREPDPTQTEIIPEPPTETPFNPWVTSTRTQTPYPGPETSTPLPYP